MPAQVINIQPSIGVIRLGRFEFSVVPQKHARLRRYLSPEDFQAIMSREYAEKAYKLLCILVPAMDPNNKEAERPIQEWEFDGFPDRETWDRFKAGDPEAYDEDNDPGPTTDEIAIAFETALKVNGTARVGKLMGLVQMASRVVELDQETKDLSQALPGDSGASPSTNSGTSPQTPTSSGV